MLYIVLVVPFKHSVNREKNSEYEEHKGTCIEQNGDVHNYDFVLIIFHSKYVRMPTSKNYLFTTRVGNNRSHDHKKKVIITFICLSAQMSECLWTNSSNHLLIISFHYEGIGCWPLFSRPVIKLKMLKFAYVTKRNRKVTLLSECIRPAIISSFESPLWINLNGPSFFIHCLMTPHWHVQNNIVVSYHRRKKLQPCLLSRLFYTPHLHSEGADRRCIHFRNFW